MNSRSLHSVFLALISAVSLLTSTTCMPDTGDEPPAHRAATHLMLDWHKLLLDLERHTPGYRAPVSTRAFAYIEMAAYEAALPALDGYLSLKNLCPGYTPPESPAQTQYCLPVALNSAYAHMVRRFFPTAPTKILAKVNDFETTFLETNSGGNAAIAVERSVQFGKDVAEAVWRFSMLDTVGHDAFLYNYDKNFAPCAELGCWQPDRNRPMPALLPHWGAVRPFFIKADDFQARPPIPFDENPGSPFHTEAMEVFSISQTRSKEDTHIAEFWSDDLPGLTVTPAGRWLSIANQALEGNTPLFSEALETYLKTNWALFNASIVCWGGKYRYQLERPVHYIQRNIQAGWVPLHETPSFPTYPSGHAIFGAAAAEVLEAQLGQGFSLTDRTHEGRSEFAGQPRQFESFEEMAQENAFSRVLLGVHFRMDCEEGLRLGKAIGQKMHSLPLRWSEAGLNRR